MNTPNGHSGIAVIGPRSGMSWDLMVEWLILGQRCRSGHPAQIQDPGRFGRGRDILLLGELCRVLRPLRPLSSSCLLLDSEIRRIIGVNKYGAVVGIQHRLCAQGCVIMCNHGLPTSSRTVHHSDKRGLLAGCGQQKTTLSSDYTPPRILVL